MKLQLQQQNVWGSVYHVYSFLTMKLLIYSIVSHSDGKYNKYRKGQKKVNETGRVEEQSRVASSPLRMLATVSFASLGRTELRLEINSGGRRSTTSSLRRSLHRQKFLFNNTF